MTIEEKAKAYDEALKRAIKHHNKDGLALEQYETIDIIFPELKESKDERIRKDIIVLVKDWWDRVNKDNISTKEQMLAWLEKQGEQKPVIEMKSAEESLGIDSNIYNEIVDECIYREQKPAWSEEDKNFMYDTLSNLTEIKDRYGEGYGNVGKCIDWVKALKQRIGG